MEFSNIVGVNKPVSRLVQGSMGLDPKEMDKGLALLDGIYSLGCNTFDTAHIYGGGGCERVLGEWIRSRGIREKVVILDKGAHHNADRRRVTPFDIASDLHDSLARLKTDYIDLYLLHRDDPSIPVGPIVEALNEHLRAGKIRAFGGSNWTAHRVSEANEYASARNLTPMAASSPQLSLVEQVNQPWGDCVSIGGPSGKADRDWYASHGMAVLCWSSLAGGFLSGRYSRSMVRALPPDNKDLPVRCYARDDNFTRLERAVELAARKGATLPQIALAYVLHLPLNVFPLVGSRSVEEFADNAKALGVKLTPSEMAYLELATEKG